jgi:exopolysaccharide biosynthesis polyprenyl glycosylphosphotransferase
MSSLIEGTAGQFLRDASAVPATGGPRSISLSPRFTWRILQIVVDLATVSAASGAGYAIYLASGLGAQHFAPPLYLNFSLGIALVTVLFLSGVGAYRNQMGALRIEAVRLVLLAVSWAFLVFVLLSFFVKMPGFSRLTVLIQGPLIAFALVFQRIVAWAAQGRLRWLRRAARPVVIYGAGETGRSLARRLMEEHHLGLRPVGFIDDAPERLGRQVKVGRGVGGATIPVLGGQDSLLELVDMTNAAAVFLAIPSASIERIEELVAYVENQKIPYFCVPTAGKLLLSGQKFGQLAGIPVFTRRRPSSDRLYALVKRAVDLIIVSVTLLLAFPLLAVSALLIKLTSPGPLFFTQERVGEQGELFKIYKLRTMHQDAPKYARHPDSSDDSRVSAVGRWLRRFSIDELPQLWNIVRGDMSCVGPRPEMPFVVENYSAVQLQRLTVKPGLSGLWQISEDRAFNIEDNIQHDLYYVENRSLSLDLAILAMTPFVVLAKHGAK